MMTEIITDSVTNKKPDRIAPESAVGIFETLKVTESGIEVPYFHWIRMKKGGDILGIAIPAYPTWISKIKKYLRETDAPEKVPFALRIEARALKGDSVYWTITTRAIPYTEEQYAQGVDLIYIADQRMDPIPLNYIKSTDYLDTASIRRTLQEKGAFEGIWLNDSGQIVEGSRSNLFFISNGAIYTPSLESGCLAGTRRQLVKEAALVLGIPYIEGDIYPRDIYQAETVFLSNSLMGIMPVRQLEEVPFGIDSPILSKLKDFMNKRIDTQTTAF